MQPASGTNQPKDKTPSFHNFASHPIKKANAFVYKGVWL